MNMLTQIQNKLIFFLKLSFFFTYFIYNTHGQQKTLLTNILYYQGTLTDLLIIEFDNLPICISEPPTKQPSFFKTKNINDIKKEFQFFLPLTSLKQQSILQTLKKLKESQNEYQISIESVNKPIRGLKMNITYDPANIGCEYGHARNGENNYLLAMHHKKNLNNVNNIGNPLRWYSNSKKRPRITIDFESNNKNITTCAQDIASQLRSKGIEVTLASKHSNYSGRIGYANCVTKSDFYLSLIIDTKANINDPIKLLLANNSIFLTRAKDLTQQNQNIINSVQKWSENKSTEWAVCFTQKLGVNNNILIYRPKKASSIECPFAAEMPAISIALSSKTINKEQLKQLASACTHAITKIISYK